MDAYGSEVPSPKDAVAPLPNVLSMALTDGDDPPSRTNARSALDGDQLFKHCSPQEGRRMTGCLGIDQMIRINFNSQEFKFRGDRNPSCQYSMKYNLSKRHPSIGLVYSLNG